MERYFKRISDKLTILIGLMPIELDLGAKFSPDIRTYFSKNVKPVRLIRNFLTCEIFNHYTFEFPTL